jgi:hypothetical protein
MAILNDYSGMGVNSAGVFLIGDYGDGVHNCVIHKRALSDGAVLWTAYDDQLFNSNGNPIEHMVRLCVDGTAIYISGVSDETEHGWRIKRLSLIDGSTVWNSFSQPGDVCFPGNINQNSSGLFVVGFIENELDNEWGWRIEKRSKDTGGILWAVEYLWASDTFMNEGFPLDVVADEDYVYIVGFEDDPVSADDKWRIEKRSQATGGLIWARNVIDAEGSLWAYAIAVYGDALYVVGDDPNGSNLLLKKIKVSDGTDYGGSWSDLQISPVLFSNCTYPASIAVNANGVYVLCQEDTAFPGNATLYHREKVNLNTGARIWARTSANNNDQFSYPTKLCDLDNFIYMCGEVLGSGTNEAAYVAKVRG